MILADIAAGYIAIFGAMFAALICGIIWAAR